MSIYELKAKITNQRSVQIVLHTLWFQYLCDHSIIGLLDERIHHNCVFAFTSTRCSASTNNISYDNRFTTVWNKPEGSQKHQQPRHCFSIV